MNSEIREFVKRVCGNDVSNASHKQIVAELRAFIDRHGASDLLVDASIYTLIEIAGIYADDDVVELLETIEEQPRYLRVGSHLRPKDSEEDERLCSQMGERVINVHLDLHYQYKDRGILFLDSENIVFTFEMIRPIRDMDGVYTGEVILNRVRTDEQLKKIIPAKYYEGKTWRFIGRDRRCQGKWFTINELLDLTSDRKIINFDHKYD